MSARRILDNVYSVGVIDWNRQVFDSLFTLTEGTSYNAYLVLGSEKTALIDTVEPAQSSILLNNLKLLAGRELDYIIANHAEQDHSGSITKVLEHFPRAKVIASAKCKEYLQQLLGLPDKSFSIISDKQIISLGDATLEFVFAPWVHWPETMFTYYQEAQLLFSCDLFGSHLATSCLFAEDDERTNSQAKSYYAQIMQPYARHVQMHLQKLNSSYPLSTIAPSHGPIYRRPDEILAFYRDWSSNLPKNQVLLLYASMHGSTEQMAEHLTDSLIKEQITVMPFDAGKAAMSQIAVAAVDAATICFASPCLNTGLHPAIASVAYALNSLKPKARYGALIGSFLWANKMAAELRGLLANLKLEYLPEILIKGLPQRDTLENLDGLAKEIKEKHSDLETEHQIS